MGSRAASMNGTIISGGLFHFRRLTIHRPAKAMAGFTCIGMMYGAANRLVLAARLIFFYIVTCVGLALAIVVRYSLAAQRPNQQQRHRRKQLVILGKSHCLKVGRKSGVQNTKSSIIGTGQRRSPLGPGLHQQETLQKMKMKRPFQRVGRSISIQNTMSGTIGTSRPKPPHGRDLHLQQTMSSMRLQTKKTRISLHKKLSLKCVLPQKGQCLANNEFKAVSQIGMDSLDGLHRRETSA